MSKTEREDDGISDALLHVASEVPIPIIGAVARLEIARRTEDRFAKLAGTVSGLGYELASSKRALSEIAGVLQVAVDRMNEIAGTRDLEELERRAGGPSRFHRLFTEFAQELSSGHEPERIEALCEAMARQVDAEIAQATRERSWATVRSLSAFQIRALRLMADGHGLVVSNPPAVIVWRMPVKEIVALAQKPGSAPVGEVVPMNRAEAVAFADDVPRMTPPISGSGVPPEMQLVQHCAGSLHWEAEGFGYGASGWQLSFRGELLLPFLTKVEASDVPS